MEKRRIITTEAAEEDIRIEGSLRPRSLDEYIGQEKAKNNLKIYIEAAKTRERAAGQGYEFVTWIWDYEKVGVSHGHYYEDDFAGAKRDFAVRSGLIPKASLFSNEELTEIYRATDHLLAEDPNLNDKQIRAIQEARIKIEFSVPDLDTQLEHRQDYSPQMEM